MGLLALTAPSPMSPGRAAGEKDKRPSFYSLPQKQQVDAIVRKAQAQQQLIRNFTTPEKALFEAGIFPGCKAEITSSVCYGSSFFDAGQAPLLPLAFATPMDHGQLSAAAAADEKVYISKEKCNFEPDGQKRLLNSNPACSLQCEFKKFQTDLMSDVGYSEGSDIEESS